MKYRTAIILSQVDVTTAGTKTEEINLTDSISRLYVKFNYTNNGHDGTAHPAKCVSKIEIVDGSDVIASLSGQQAEALNFFDMKEKRGHELEYRNDVVGEMVFPINFGRFRYDPQLALDPKRFRNPQIKVTHNKASGGSAPDAATMEIFADVFDEKLISPLGFLMSKEYYSYTLVAGAYEHIDLPTDHILRRLLLLSQTVAYELSDQIAEVKLSEDNDKKVPVDLTIADLMRLAAAEYGQYVEEMVCTFSSLAAKTWYVTPTNKVYVNPSPIGANPVYTSDEDMGGRQRFEAPSAITAFRAHISGFEPHGSLPIDFGNQKDLDDWFDVTKLGNLRLRLKGGSSPSGSCAVVTQQLRHY